MSDLLETYEWAGNSYKRMAGTDGWVEVARLGDQGGYDWCDFNAFYSPLTRRYFWHGAAGCSCNSWQDDLESVDDFENGDRAALLRAWEAFAKLHHYTIHVTEYTHGVTTIKNFEEPNV